MMKPILFQMEIRRHGKWDYKKDKLSTEGRKEAEKLSEQLPIFDYVLCSTAGRAKETATVLSKGKEGEAFEILDEIIETVIRGESAIDMMLQQGEKALVFLQKKMLGRRPKNMLVVTSGRLLGAMWFYLHGKTPHHLRNFHVFEPLKGIHISLNAELISG